MNHLFKLETPRNDALLTLSDPAISSYVHKEKKRGLILSHLSDWISELDSVVRPEPVDPWLRGFHHVALLRDLQNSPETENE